MSVKKKKFTIKKVTPVTTVPLPKKSAKEAASEYYNSQTDREDSSMKALVERDYAFDEDEISIEVRYAGKKTTSYLNFEIGAFNHCCGSLEVGGLSANVLSNEDMDELFTALLHERKNTLMITTVPSQKSWNAWLNNTELFQAVKSWKNGGNGNLITLWVSTN